MKNRYCGYWPKSFICYLLIHNILGNLIRSEKKSEVSLLEWYLDFILILMYFIISTVKLNACLLDYNI